MKAIPYILYLFLLTFHDTILVELISIKGVVIDITILLVVLVSMYKSEEESLWFGFMAGLVTGAMDISTMPVQIVTIVIIATLANQMAVRINLESIISRVIILSSAVVVHKIVMTLTVSGTEFFYILITSVLPAAVYTLIVGLIYFMLKDGRITWQKVKALF